MSKRKGKLMIQRKAAYIEPQKSVEQALYFFTVTIADDEIEKVEQLPDWPFDSNHDNGSLLSMHEWGIAIQVTWRPFKPEPASELRYKGYLAIMDELGSRNPKLAEAFARSSFGFGHPEGATIEWHKPEGDDA